MDTAQEVRRILAGSCTPALDLLVLVDDGKLTAWRATEILRDSGRRISDVHSAAAAEREYMQVHDI